MGNKEIPIFRGFLPVDKKTLPREALAGLTLAVISIPEVMGYTKISGTPIVTGIYTILFPMLIYAIFGSSKHLVVAADSATAAIMAQALIPLAAQNSPQYMSLAGLLALMVGALLLICRLVRLGFISNFLSRTVLAGFLTGVGIQVLLQQIGGMLGIGTDGGAIQQFITTISQITKMNGYALGLSAFTVIVILVPGWFAKKLPWLAKLPWALVAIIGTSLAGSLMNLKSLGVSFEGAVPGGLPHFALPGITFANVSALLATAVTIVVVIITQSAATSTAYANRYGEAFNENQDLLALGCANIAAGLSGAFVVNGSPTKTEISDSAGSRSQVGNIVAVAFVAVLLLFFTGPLQYMPTPTLCAIVFVIGLRLINFKNMKRIYSLKRSEFTLALLTASVVVTVGAAQGIIFAMALALLQHVRRSYKPNNSLMLLQKRGDQTIWTWQPVASQAQTLPGLVVYHFAASLYYANARVFGEEVTALAGNIPGLHCLLLDFSAIADVDFTGGEMITEVCRKLLGKNISVRCARIENHVMQQLTAYGFIDVVKPENIHSHIEAAMAQFEAAENGRG